MSGDKMAFKKWNYDLLGNHILAMQTNLEYFA